eukprot:SAG31_NODE_1102_length_9897_cov_16.273015_12_plen_1001_part_00
MQPSSALLNGLGLSEHAAPGRTHALEDEECDGARGGELERRDAHGGAGTVCAALLPTPHPKRKPIVDGLTHSLTHSLCPVLQDKANALAALDDAAAKREVLVGQRDALASAKRRGSIEIPGIGRRRNSKELSGLTVRVEECDQQVAGLQAVLREAEWRVRTLTEDLEDAEKTSALLASQVRMLAPADDEVCNSDRAEEDADPDLVAARCMSGTVDNSAADSRTPSPWHRRYRPTTSLPTQHGRSPKQPQELVPQTNLQLAEPSCAESVDDEDDYNYEEVEIVSDESSEDDEDLNVSLQKLGDPSCAKQSSSPEPVRAAAPVPDDEAIERLDKNQDMGTSLPKARSKGVREQARNGSLRAQVQALQKALAQRNKEISSLRTDAQALQQQVHRQEVRLQAKVDASGMLRNAEENVLSLRQNVDALATENDVLRKENTIMRAQMSSGVENFIAGDPSADDPTVMQAETMYAQLRDWIIQFAEAGVVEQHCDRTELVQMARRGDSEALQQIFKLDDETNGFGSSSWCVALAECVHNRHHTAAATLCPPRVPALLVRQPPKTAQKRMGSRQNDGGTGAAANISRPHFDVGDWKSKVEAKRRAADEKSARAMQEFDEELDKSSLHRGIRGRINSEQESKLAERLSVWTKRAPPCQVPPSDMSPNNPHDVQRSFEQMISNRALTGDVSSPDGSKVCKGKSNAQSVQNVSRLRNTVQPGSPTCISPSSGTTHLSPTSPASNLATQFEVCVSELPSSAANDELYRRVTKRLQRAEAMGSELRRHRKKLEILAETERMCRLWEVQCREAVGRVQKLEARQEKEKQTVVYLRDQLRTALAAGKSTEGTSSEVSERLQKLEEQHDKDRQTIIHLRGQLRAAFANNQSVNEDASTHKETTLQRQVTELRRQLKARAAMDRTCRLVAAQALSEVDGLRSEVSANKKVLAEVKKLASKEARNHKAAKEELAKAVALTRSLQTELDATNDILHHKRELIERMKRSTATALDSSTSK